MHTYYGQFLTDRDAVKLFEACRVGLLPRVLRRLSEQERESIRHGSVFVWDEEEARIRRWTDGKKWTSSRLSDGFMTYREIGTSCGRRLTNKLSQRSCNGKCCTVRDALIKRSFSVTTSAGHRLHLIAYHSQFIPRSLVLPQPTTDPKLRHINPVQGMYKDGTLSHSALHHGGHQIYHEPFPLSLVPPKARCRSPNNYPSAQLAYAQLCPPQERCAQGDPIKMVPPYTDVHTGYLQTVDEKKRYYMTTEQPSIAILVEKYHTSSQVSNAGSGSSGALYNIADSRLASPFSRIIPRPDFLSHTGSRFSRTLDHNEDDIFHDKQTVEDRRVIKALDRRIAF